jgi:hypothetical protein
VRSPGQHPDKATRQTQTASVSLALASSETTTQAPQEQIPRAPAFLSDQTTRWRIPMMRGALLWIIGIPLPIIIVLWLLGYLS